MSGEKHNLEEELFQNAHKCEIMNWFVHCMNISSGSQTFLAFDSILTTISSDSRNLFFFFFFPRPVITSSDISFYLYLFKILCGVLL